MVAEHPGPHINRFIFFRSRSGRRPFCLEFISNCKSEKLEPGFSLAAETPLGDYFAGIEGDRFLKPTLTHRNYQWQKKGNRKRLPGWNFLNFGARFPAANVWLTEFESIPGEKRRRIVRKYIEHPNKVCAIVGFEFEVTPTGKRFFEGVLGKKLGGSVTLACGTRVFFTDASRNRFRYVILKTTDLKMFCTRGNPDRILSYRGRKAALLKNPSKSWDILVMG